LGSMVMVIVFYASPSVIVSHPKFIESHVSSSTLS
jgi:hypothetical protein